jgi:hypothetical protein
MKRILTVGILLLIVFQMTANAQQKFERESRLKADEVPAEAIRFIEAVDMQTKWKWYYEENLKGNSVEAKTKYGGKRYSVEFDPSGDILDVEVETGLQELDKNVRDKIIQELDSLFVRYKIEKIQVQYTAGRQLLISLLNGKSVVPDLNVQYEIVVKGRTVNRPKLYELTFTDAGRLIDSSEIIFRNTDNLVY